MFLAKLLVIATMLPIFSCLAVEGKVLDQRVGWKIQRITKPMRFPSDVAFYNEENKKSYIEDFEGKTLLVVFWATWCAPCHKEILELDILKKDFRKLSLDILPISQDYQGVAAVKDFYEKNEIRYLPIYHDYRNELFRELGIAGLPTCYILDNDGLIKAIITGTINWHADELREILLEFIEGNPIMPKNSYKDNSLNQSTKAVKPKEVLIEPKEKNEEVVPTITDNKDAENKAQQNEDNHKAENINK